VVKELMNNKAYDFQHPGLSFFRYFSPEPHQFP